MAEERDKDICECVKIEQDETCPVGFPSLLCDTCDGIGRVSAKGWLGGKQGETK